MTDPLTLAVEAARAAGRIQREHAERAATIAYKGDIDPVTEVDLLCEKEILSRIRTAFPDHEILAEESGEAAGTAEWRWLIDPLDGTVNYAHGFPCYCVSIALERRGRVELGVVYNPNLDELFAARRGEGATLNGRPIRVSRIDTLKRSLLVTGFAYNVRESSNNNLDHFANFVMEGQAVRRPGSAAIDLCYTACGRFEGFWELNLNPWDYAAGWLFVEEAGGRVTRFDGEPFRLGDREILASNGRVHAAMVEVLGRGHSRGERVPS